MDPQNSQSSTPKPANKWKILGLIVLILVVVSALDGLYSTMYVADDFTPDSPPATSAPIDTSDWQTYRDDEHGFELKYPPGYLNVESGGGKDYKEFQASKTDLSTGEAITLVIHAGDYSKDQYCYNEAPANGGAGAEEVINKIWFLRYKYDLDPSPVNYPGKHQSLQIWSDDGVCYHIGLNIWKEQINSSDFDILTEIAGSLKFDPITIEIGDWRVPENWKMYRNSEYGFELKYPPDWITEIPKSGMESGFLRLRTKEHLTSVNEVGEGSADLTVSLVIPDLPTSFEDWYDVNSFLFQRPLRKLNIMPRSLTAFLTGTKELADCCPEIFVPSPDGRFFIDFFNPSINPQSTEIKIISTLKFSAASAPADTADWQTYRNEKYGFEVRYPEEWFVQFEEPSITLASAPKEDNAHGVGLPQGGMWVKVSKGICNNATADFQYEGPRPSTWEKRICQDDFSIVLGYWPKEGAEVSEDEMLLDQILSTFRFVN